MKPTILAGLWRSRSVKFWEFDYLIYLVEELRFKSEAAGAIAGMGLAQRKQQAYAGITSKRS